MEKMKRFAIYYAPEPGPFADAAARWLGWDADKRISVPQPRLDFSLAELVAEPRRYGFHGTLKPPFRLAHQWTLADLRSGIAQLSSRLHPLQMTGLRLANLDGFLAFVPEGDSLGLQTLAAEIVQALDPYRAALNDREIARRRPERLTPRQRYLLSTYGYPYVLEEFRFHLTLSGPMGHAEAALMRAASAHFSGVIPEPFLLKDICLFGEDDDGVFHLMERYPLTA